MTATIEIFLKGKRLLIDGQDYHFICNQPWYISATGYVVRRPWKSATTYLHKEILGVQNSTLVDHINLDKLDNRRCNLRLATKAQNNSNRGKRNGKYSSRFKGVYFNSKTKKPWVAQIALGAQETRFLGCYATEEEAARAYDIAALERFGEFAKLNFGEVVQ